MNDLRQGTWNIMCNRWLPTVSLGFLLISGLFLLDQRAARRVDARSASRAERIPSSDRSASASIERGRAEVSKGNWASGQIYLVNAITAAPRDIKILGDCVELILNAKDQPPQIVDRFSSILELAAYQVDPGDIPAALKLRERLEAARGTDISPTPGGPSVSTEDVEQSYKRLAATEKIWHSAEKLGAHREALRELAETAASLEKAVTPELNKKIIDQVERWSQIAKAAGQAAYVDGCLRRLEAEKEHLDSDLAVSIVQAAENVLPTFWGIDPKSLPEDLRAKIDGYPKAVTGWVETIGDARSAPVVVKIRGILEKADGGGSNQYKITNFIKAVGEAQSLATGLKSTKALGEYQAILGKYSEEIQKCKQNQYDSYQKFVIDKCNDFYTAFKEYKLDISSKEARMLFEKFEFAEVDHSLLSPETAKLFFDLYGKLAEEMDAEPLVKTEHEMATAKKKKLEDF